MNNEQLAVITGKAVSTFTELYEDSFVTWGGFSGKLNTIALDCKKNNMRLNIVLSEDGQTWATAWGDLNDREAEITNLREFPVSDLDVPFLINLIKEEAHF